MWIGAASPLTVVLARQGRSRPRLRLGPTPRKDTSKLGSEPESVTLCELTCTVDPTSSDYGKLTIFRQLVGVDMDGDTRLHHRCGTRRNRG